MSDTFTLPNGEAFTLRADITSKESAGIKVLIAASSLSLISVACLLITISLSAFNTRRSTDKHLFVRTHVAAYFVSLLVCDLLQSVGSIMNEKWIQHLEVYIGSFCTAQGAIKHASDVGTAIWALVLAINAFFVLFLRREMRAYVLWLTLLSGWCAIGTIVIAGPAALNTSERGPFFGISGYWCWISPGYEAERITLDYMFMFLSALFSFILYSLVFLRLRGNIVVSGWSISFCRADQSKNASWGGRDFADNQSLAIARQMLLYPVAYTIIILPIAVARFTGGDVSFGATIFCDTIYLLSGTVNVVLFTTTRRILPPKSIIPGRFVISRPRLVASSLEEGDYLPSEDEKSPISILKGGDAYRSDFSHANSTKSGKSLPPEYFQEPVRPLEIRHAHSQPSSNVVRESGESTFDLYAETTYRRSEIPRITEEEFRQSEATRNSGRPGFSDVRLDE